MPLRPVVLIVRVRAWGVKRACGGAAGQKGHNVVALVEAIEAEIDRLAAQLWGLTEEELGEIQRNLEELR